VTRIVSRYLWRPYRTILVVVVTHVRPRYRFQFRLRWRFRPICTRICGSPTAGTPAVVLASADGTINAKAPNINIDNKDFFISLYSLFLLLSAAAARGLRLSLMAQALFRNVTKGGWAARKSLGPHNLT
jgi:hypothetical protein